MAKEPTKVSYLKNVLSGHVFEIWDPSHRAYLLKQTRDEEDHEQDPLFTEVDQAEAQRVHAQEDVANGLAHLTQKPAREQHTQQAQHQQKARQARSG